MNYKDIITIEPAKRGGKPCIRGMRITVYDVLDYLASGMTIEEILDDFPYLTAIDIRACLAYAADREKAQMVVYANETPIGSEPIAQAKELFSDSAGWSFANGTLDSKGSRALPCVD